MHVNNEVSGHHSEVLRHGKDEPHLNFICSTAFSQCYLHSCCEKGEWSSIIHCSQVLSKVGVDRILKDVYFIRSKPLAEIIKLSQLLIIRQNSKQFFCFRTLSKVKYPSTGRISFPSINRNQRKSKRRGRHRLDLEFSAFRAIRAGRLVVRISELNPDRWFLLVVISAPLNEFKCYVRHQAKAR